MVLELPSPVASEKKKPASFYLIRGSEAILVDRHILIGRYYDPNGALVELKSHEGVQEFYTTTSRRRPAVRFLAKSTITIPSNHITVSPDDEVNKDQYQRLSKHHALILYAAHRDHPLYVLDPASQNGVYVNKRKVKPAPGGVGKSLEDALGFAHPLFEGDTLRLIMTPYHRAKVGSEGDVLAPQQDAVTYDLRVACVANHHQEPETIRHQEHSIFTFKQ